MPDHSSPQGLPDDWSRGSHAARGPFSGAATADGYGAETAGAHSARATDAYRTVGFRTPDADGYGAENSDAFGKADPFGEGGMFGPAAGEAGAARADADPADTVVGDPVPGQAAGARGFLGALFDFGFTSFVTPKVVRVLYMLITIGTVVSALVFTIVVFKASTPFGVLTLLFGDPLFILIVMAIYRMILEFFMVTHRAAEDLRALRERGDLG
ncbi:MAG TPA: DUF4282 domain-containing protein [Streptosporangiaceae bacterium]